MPITKQRIIHASTHYYPINGGQQLYIEQLNNVFGKFEKIIIQLESAPAVDMPEEVISLKCPYFLSYKGLQSYGYNYRLKEKVDQLAIEEAIDLNNDLFISHYAFHYRSLKHAKNVIYLSHGVEWDGPGGLFKKLYHFHRFWINKNLIRNPNVTIVANDCNYYRKMGLSVGVDNYFKEVQPRKWLVPNCIDTAFFSPHKSFSPKFTKPTIVIPRNIVPQRGIDLVIKSFKEISDHVLMNNYELVIVGAAYDKVYFDYLLRLVAELGLNARVKFHGSIPRNEMRDVYLSAELVVIYSTFREGTSLAALEAMSCGTPVITSNVGGLKDLPTVKSETNNLATKILETITVRNKIGKQQKEWVVQNHDFKKWTTFWLNQIGLYGIK